MVLDRCVLWFGAAVVAFGVGLVVAPGMAAADSGSEGGSASGGSASSSANSSNSAGAAANSTETPSADGVVANRTETSIESAFTAPKSVVAGARSRVPQAKAESTVKTSAEKPGAADETVKSTDESQTESSAQSRTEGVDATATTEAATQLSSEDEAASTSTETAAPASRATAVAAPAIQAPPPPSLINVIGTAFFNVVSAVINAAVGPPVAPPGSTVTVRQSTLDIGSITVPADWYFPAGPEPPKGLIYLQHGALASGPMYSYTAARLAEETHSIVVAPSLSTNVFAADGMWLGGAPMQRAVADLFLGERPALTASATAAAGRPVTLPEGFVLVGHSLGGGLAAAAAGYTVNNGASRNLKGVVLLDPVGVSNAIPAAMDKLPDDLPVLMIAAPPYAWNQFGSGAAELAQARPGEFIGFTLEGGLHIDAMQGGNPLIQFSAYLAAGFSQPQNIQAAQTLAEGWINDMFDDDGTPNGIYAQPGQRVQIGGATAIAPPLPPTPLTPFTDLARVLSTLGSNFLFGLLGNEPATATSVPAAAQQPDFTRLTA